MLSEVNNTQSEETKMIAIHVRFFHNMYKTEVFVRVRFQG